MSRLDFSVELKKTLRAENATILQELVSEHSHLERQMVDGFHLCPTKRFREGNLKTSFIYLLIDPRISENLPGESQLIPTNESWQRFIPSIFYVGKGKCSRPYAHLYDAIKIYQGTFRFRVYLRCDKRLSRIEIFFFFYILIQINEAM